MFEILDRQNLAPGIVLFEVLAPRIAKKHRAGQFVMVRPSESSERIPLPVASTSLARQSISVAVKTSGKTTVEMSTRFDKGDSFHNVAGPLGTPVRILLPGKEEGERGTVVCVAGGIGAATMLPIARAFTEKGHEVVTITGARTAELLILRNHLDEASERLLVSTDDGSLGRKGVVTGALSDFIGEQRNHGEDVHMVIAIGPALMMKACAELTRLLSIPILVSLNTVIVDGIGRCGSCRALIGGETKYVCVDGPGFDGHLVDFEALIRRQKMYASEETGALYRHTEQHICHAEAAIVSYPEVPVAAVLASWEINEGTFNPPTVEEPSGFSVAVIGSGPAGLSCAGDLRRRGHAVTVFEAYHRAGGVLVCEIPEFRLPKDVVEIEITHLAQLGVKFEFDTVIGQTLTIDDLFDEGFDAIFVATGAGLPLFGGFPGEDLNGVYTATEYLARASMKGTAPGAPQDTPLLRQERIAVLGGSNTAIDAARTALRNGARAVTLLFKHSRQEMSAGLAEVRRAEEEGVAIECLASVLEILGTPDGWVRGVRYQRLQSHHPRGTRRSLPDTEEPSELAADLVIEAIGNQPNPLIPRTTPGLAISQKGRLVIDEKTMMTARRGVFAGGDLVAGPGGVLVAVGQGRRAAAAIDSFLSTPSD